MNQKKSAIILAAGKGKRMKSDIPKVLHAVSGKPLIRHLLETLSKLDFDKIVVVIGYKGEQVIEKIKDFDVEFVWQREQRGTGHAVLMARDIFDNYDGDIIVAFGDVPFLSAESVNSVFDTHHKFNASATCLTAEFDDPKGYGRIIRKPGTQVLLDIVEQKDADPETLKIKEINSGTFCFDCRDLFSVLPDVGEDNAQKEQYLTDTIKLLNAKGKVCVVVKSANPFEVKGVNSAEELLALEKARKN
ncbi:MAG: NTP transferase domain-containing protein [Candidatus Zixiibacteriota bacterium]